MCELRPTLLLLIVGSSIFAQAKPQYDIINSGSSATTTKAPSPIVRVDGDVHADEAEENKLPGGLNPSNYDSGGQAQKASPATSTSKNEQKPNASSHDRKAQQGGKPPLSSSKDHSTADVTKPKTRNEPNAANLTIIPTKRPQSANAYESDGVPNAKSEIAQHPDSQKDKSEGAVLGETTGAPSELTTPESSGSAESSATTPSEGSQSTTGLPETSASPASSSNEQPTEGPSSTEQQTTPSASTTGSYEGSEEAKAEDHATQPFSSELYESSTPTNNEQVPTTGSSVNVSTASGEIQESAETTTTQGVSTTGQSSYESAESNSSSPIPPVAHGTSEQKDTSTLPPAIEPSSPGTTPEQAYESTTAASTSSVEESQSTTQSSSTPASNEQQSTDEPETASSEASPVESSSEQSSTQSSTPQETAAGSTEPQPTTIDYSPTTQAPEQAVTSQTAESNDATTASSLNAETTAGSGSRLGATKDSSHSSGYDPDSPLASVLSKPPAISQKPENQQPSDSPPSAPPPPTQPKKPNSKPRAWKISQGGSQPVDGSTGTSDNEAKPAANVNENKNSQTNVQSSGYDAINEIKPQTEKPTHVVSAQEAVGYDGIAETPATMAQRDPVVERAEISLTRLQKKLDTATPRRKWQKYEFNCETEADDRGEALCQEWARGGLCEDHRPTRFLFCRKTCLCVGPIEDPVAELKPRRRKRLHNVRL